ncbi:MAG: hypothetical protein IBV52_07265 [Candidatus Bathyarchaeota archaeon]
MTKLVSDGTIFLTIYLTAPLMRAANKTDIQNLKEMLKALGPLAPLFTLPLFLIEKITIIFHKS